jgi:hypothetical protein
MIYRFTAGAQLPVDAQTAGEALERIRRHRGAFFTPADVVEASRLPRASLHRCFEWDDAVAAAAHRITQAGYLIRHVEVIPAAGTNTPPARAFVSVTQDGGRSRSYTSISAAMQDAGFRAQILAQALADVESFVRRYDQYYGVAELMSVVTAKIKTAAAE